MTQTRFYTNRVLEAVSEGSLDKDALIQTLLMWMSEHDVKQMVLANDLQEILMPDGDEEDDMEELLSNPNYVGSKYHY